MQNPKEKTILVTGASSGIGKATAVEFSKKGHQVILADVLEKEGHEVAKEIEKIGLKPLFVTCDISKEDEVKNLFEKIHSQFGKLDYAFNNAGIEGEQALTSDCSEANWDRVINTNLKGTWLCMKHEIPLMLRQKEGAIVNCASVAGLVGFAGVPAYAASKHGVVGLTKSAALEYSKSGIRINAVCPGVIQTPMIDRFVHGDEALKAELTLQEPMGRLGRPEEIATTVFWLCSEAASFVTGQAIAVDGGWTSR